MHWFGAKHSEKLLSSPQNPPLEAHSRAAFLRIATHSRVQGHSNWQIQTAVWNSAGFLHCALETCWQRFGQFLNDFLGDFLIDLLDENLNFLCEHLDFFYENLNFLYENLTFSLWKLWMLSSVICLIIHKISYHKDRFITGGVKTRWLGWKFLNGL